MAAAVHRGVPLLVPMVGVGTLLGVRSWPRVVLSKAHQSTEAVLRLLMKAMGAKEHQIMLNWAVVQPGYPGTLPKGEWLDRLAWLCRAPPNATESMLPVISEYLQSSYPQDAQVAHRALLDSLREADRRPELKPYAQRNLLQHAAHAGGVAELQHVLFDRKVLGMLLEGDRASLLRQLRTLSRRDARIRGLIAELATIEPNSQMVDGARARLAPDWPWESWLPAAQLARAGVNGAGVRVAIVSTGVDARHPELQHLQLEGVGAQDPQGHGTAVASIIAGRFIGLAPGVDLHSSAVLDAQGSGDFEAIARELQRLMDADPAVRPDIVCLPLGAEGDVKNGGAVTEALQGMVARGVLVIAAAGNSGRNSLSFPAVLSEVLSVGGVNDQGEPAAFSNHGRVGPSDRPSREGPDLWAPAVDRLVATPPDRADPGEVWSVSPGFHWGYAAPYAIESGTSFACAAVSGVAALYAQATGLRGEALRAVLLQTAQHGQARFDLAAAMGGSKMPPQEAGATVQVDAGARSKTEAARIEAVPGKDVVVVKIEDGPELILHPETARDLLSAARDNAPTR